MCAFGPPTICGLLHPAAHSCACVGYGDCLCVNQRKIAARMLAGSQDLKTAAPLAKQGTPVHKLRTACRCIASFQRIYREVVERQRQEVEFRRRQEEEEVPTIAPPHTNCHPHPLRLS